MIFIIAPAATISFLLLLTEYTISGLADFVIRLRLFLAEGHLLIKLQVGNVVLVSTLSNMELKNRFIVKGPICGH